MIQIHTQLVGTPQTHTDARGTWRSTIFRTPVAEPIALAIRGLADDQVADTKYHGSPDQAVCCHLLDHYAYWNKVYELSTPETQLGPGSIGENWTLTGTTEQEVCIGDIYTVGSARVQVSGPRVPCSKQERKVKLPKFQKRTLENLRTGFYLRVLTPGSVQAGDELRLEERLYSDISVHAVNVGWHHTFDLDQARQLVAVPELSAAWRAYFQSKLDKQAA